MPGVPGFGFRVSGFGLGGQGFGVGFRVQGLVTRGAYSSRNYFREWLLLQDGLEPLIFKTCLVLPIEATKVRTVKPDGTVEAPLRRLHRNWTLFPHTRSVTITLFPSPSPSLPLAPTHSHTHPLCVPVRWSRYPGYPGLLVPCSLLRGGGPGFLTHRGTLPTGASRRPKTP